MGNHWVDGSQKTNIKAERSLKWTWCGQWKSD